MASFELAHKEFLKTQGLNPFFNSGQRDAGDILLCSECFNDEGLRLDAALLGLESGEPCPRCTRIHGKKLTQQIVRELSYRFFVRGTIEHFEYGGCPLIQMNEPRYGDSNISVSPWLEEDFVLLENAGRVGFFYYRPRLCAMGDNMPLKALQNPDEAGAVIEQIISLYPKHILTQDHPFYRLRVNPEKPGEFVQYDSPPDGAGGDKRFDGNGFPVLYASPDLELCIQECRTSAEDDLYVAKLVPTRHLHLLNLAAVLKQDDVDEFESLDLCLHFLFLATKHSYKLCAQIANRVKELGFDGIIYPSYFSNLRTGHIPFETIQGLSVRVVEPLNNYAQSQTVPNLAIFGRPVAEGKLAVHSINKIVLNSIKYDISFGPVDHAGIIDKNDKNAFVQKRKQELADNMNTLMEQIKQGKHLKNTTAPENS